MSYENETTPPEQKPAAFCQNCGRPLEQSAMRVVGSSVFCEPCLAARIGVPTPNYAADPTPPYANGYTPVNGGAAGWTVPPYRNSSAPNPGLAALLGFIPGVGAMYNEQYAKGIVHLLVFATLVSLSHAAGIFGLLIAGWVFYMVIEAHHTARARRDGTPLPNPFGLNDLSERLGFGRNWGAPAAGAWPTPGPAAQPAPAAAAPDPVPTQPWGAPVEATPYPPSYAQPEVPTAAYSTPYTQPYAPNPGYYTPPANPYTAPYAAPYTPVQAPDPLVAQALARRNRFPTGAIWLIALGIIFLVATTGIFEGVFGEALVGFALIGLAVYVFIKRMLDTGYGLASDGTANYLMRVIRALRGSIWIFLVGLLIVLDRFSILYWSHSWPWFIIVAGLMMLIERTAVNSAAAASQYPPPMPAPVPPVGTSIVPSTNTPQTPEGGN